MSCNAPARGGPGAPPASQLKHSNSVTHWGKQQPPGPLRCHCKGPTQHNPCAQFNDFCGQGRLTLSGRSCEGWACTAGRSRAPHHSPIVPTKAAETTELPASTPITYQPQMGLFGFNHPELTRASSTSLSESSSCFAA